MQFSSNAVDELLFGVSSVIQSAVIARTTWEYVLLIKFYIFRFSSYPAPDLVAAATAAMATVTVFAAPASAAVDRDDDDCHRPRPRRHHRSSLSLPSPQPPPPSLSTVVPYRCHRTCRRLRRGRFLCSRRHHRRHCCCHRCCRHHHHNRRHRSRG